MSTPTSAAAAAHAAAERATQAWASTREKAGEALGTGERYVREYPAISVLGVFGVGLLLGLLVGWSAAHEEREDYTATARKFFSRWGSKLHID